MTNLSSSRLLLNLLTSSKSFPLPLEIISSELKSYKEKLIKCLDFFNKSNLKTIPQNVNKDNFEYNDFVALLSFQSNLDVKLAEDIFKLFLKFEYKFSNKHLELQIKTEFGRKELSCQVDKFIFKEKIFLLCCLIHLFCHFDSEEHIYHEIFNEFVVPLYDSYNFVYKIRDQYFQLINEIENIYIAANRTTAQQISMDKILQNISLQYKLLEIIMLYYRHMVHLPEDLIILFQHFKDQGFGRRIVSKKHCNEDIEKLSCQIGFLQVIILIEGVNIQKLNEISNDNSILNEMHFKKFDSLISSLENTRVNSPLFLCWAIVRHMAEVDAGVFGMYAIKCGVFDYLHSCLKMRPFCADRNIMSIVTTLISATLFCFNEETIGDVQSLIKITVKVLEQSLIAEDFWVYKNNSGMGFIFDSYLNLFPCKIIPSLNILTSLCKSKRSISLEICDYFKTMNLFSEKLSESTKLIYEGLDKGENFCKLAISKYAGPYKNNELVIKSYSDGQLLTTQKGGNNMNLIQWNVTYNAWHVFTEEINLFLFHPAANADILEEPMDRVLAILDFFAAQLFYFDVHEDIFTAEFNYILNSAYNLISRYYKSVNVHKQLLNSCFNVILQHAKMDPIKTWSQLKSIDFLKKSISFDSNDDNSEVGIYWYLLTTFELVHNDFSISDNVLDILLKLGKSLKETEFMAEFVVFVIWFASNPFPHFKNNDLSGLIQHKSINLFVEILDALEMQKSSCLKLSESQATLVDILISREASLTLFNIINIGIDYIEDQILLNINCIENENISIIALISSAFLLLNKLIYLNPKSTKIKNIFNLAFFSSTNSQSLKQIAFYIFNLHDANLTVQATIYLKNLAELYPLSLLSLFGDSAVAIKNIFLRRLSNFTENNDLKVAITDFFTTCLHTQPGLFSLLINPDPNDSNNMKLDLVNILLEILTIDNQKTKKCSNMVLSSILELIHAIWKNHCLILDDLRNRVEFWPSISFLLFNEEISFTDNNLKDRVTYMRCLANIFRILSLELHCNKKLCKEFISVINQLFGNKKVVYFSEFINSQIEYFISNDFVASKPDTFKNNESLGNLPLHQLLSAWRDMLVIAATYKGYEIFIENKGEVGVSNKDCIFRNTLIGLQYLLISTKHDGPKNISKYLSSTVLILSKYWQCSTIAIEHLLDTCKSLLVKCIDVLAACHEETFIYLFSSLSLQIKHSFASGGLNEVKILELLKIICNLPLHLSPNMEKDKSCHKMTSTLVGLATEMVTYLNRHTKSDSYCMDVIQETSFLMNILSLAAKLTLADIDSATIIFTFLLEISKIQKGAMIIFQNDLLNQISFVSDNLSMGKNTPNNAQLNQRRFFQLHTGIIINLLHLLPSFPSSLPFDFLHLNFDRLVSRLQVAEEGTAVLKAFEEESVVEVMRICELMESIASIRRMRQMPAVYQQILSCLCVWLQNAILFFAQPRLISFLIEQDENKSSTKSSKSASKSPLRLSFSEDLEYLSPLVIQIQNRLLFGISHCLSVLRVISPSLSQLLLDINFDCSLYNVFMELQFSSPAAESRNTCLSYFTFISLLNTSIDLLSRMEGVKSHSPLKLSAPRSPQLILAFSKRQLMYVIENCMLLICTQTLLKLFSTDLSVKDKNLLKREISIELNLMMMGLQRHLRVGPTSPMTPRRLSQEPLTPLLAKEHPFFALINAVNKQVFS